MEQAFSIVRRVICVRQTDEDDLWLENVIEAMLRKKWRRLVWIDL